MSIIHLWWSIVNIILGLSTPKFTSKHVKNVNLDPRKDVKWTKM